MAFTTMLSTSPITGGEHHAPMRCLRRRTGAARTCPPTVYVKSLYRIGGQDYCRHHIIKAVVAAGVVAEIKAGAGPAVAMPRQVPSRE